MRIVISQYKAIIYVLGLVWSIGLLIFILSCCQAMYTMYSEPVGLLTIFKESAIFKELAIGFFFILTFLSVMAVVGVWQFVGLGRFDIEISSEGIKTLPEEYFNLQSYGYAYLFAGMHKNKFIKWENIRKIEMQTYYPFHIISGTEGISDNDRLRQAQILFPRIWFVENPDAVVKYLTENVCPNKFTCALLKCSPSVKVK